MNNTYTESKMFHAKHLADDQRDLTAVMLYIGAIWGTCSPAEIMEMGRRDSGN